jgi:hypothetical protein
VKSECFACLELLPEGCASNANTRRFREILSDNPENVVEQERELATFICSNLIGDISLLEDILLKPCITAWLADLYNKYPDYEERLCSMFWVLATKCDPNSAVLSLETLIGNWARYIALAPDCILLVRISSGCHILNCSYARAAESTNPLPGTKSSAQSRWG